MCSVVVHPCLVSAPPARFTRTSHVRQTPLVSRQFASRAVTLPANLWPIYGQSILPDPTCPPRSHTPQVLRCADYFDLSHLKQSCEALVAAWDVIQVENVVPLYEHAHQVGAKQLQGLCIQYVRAMFDVVELLPEYRSMADELKQPIIELGRGGGRRLRPQ